jgi:hypothetical protein
VTAIREQTTKIQHISFIARGSHTGCLRVRVFIPSFVCICFFIGKFLLFVFGLPVKRRFGHNYLTIFLSPTQRTSLGRMGKVWRRGINLPKALAKADAIWYTIDVSNSPRGLIKKENES